MHVVLFDIDGTLVNSGGAGRAALETAFAEEFGVPVRERVVYSGRTDRAIARDLLSFHGIEATDPNWLRLRDRYLAHLPDALTRHPGVVLPGIAALLEQLGPRRDLVLGLLTGNVREGARLKLAHFGLFHHFAFGGYGDRHFDRDHVACEALAAARAHLDDPLHPERIWVVGDTPLDVACARAIGAKVAAVATGWHPVEELEASRPDLLLADLSDPSALLDRLGG